MKILFSGSTDEESGDKLFIKDASSVDDPYKQLAPIAQLDRAAVFETEGSRFKSWWV